MTKGLMLTTKESNSNSIDDTKAITLGLNPVLSLIGLSKVIESSRSSCRSLMAFYICYMDL
jgi:hypothetical protein